MKIYYRTYFNSKYLESKDETIAMIVSYAYKTKSVIKAGEMPLSEIGISEEKIRTELKKWDTDLIAKNIHLRWCPKEKTPLMFAIIDRKI